MTDHGTDGTVHLERDYAATPGEIWDAWTSPERMARWLGVPSGPVLGGSTVRLTMGDEEHERADLRVIAADPPHRLELAWTFFGEAESLLTLELTPISATHTRLTLRHSGLSGTVGYGAGWTVYLDGELAENLGGAAVVGSWDERWEAAAPAWRERAGTTLA